MGTAHDNWLEAPYQEAQEAADPVDRKMADWGWLAARMKSAADYVCDDLADALCEKPEWTDADALLVGRILMDQLRKLAELEARL